MAAKWSRPTNQARDERVRCSVEMEIENMSGRIEAEYKRGSQPEGSDWYGSLISSVVRQALVLAAVGLAGVSLGAQAADWYVRPNGASYGAASGKTWTDAFSGFSAIPWNTVACGDTIWVAGGDYSQDLQPAKKCSSSARLSIRRARSDVPATTGAAGWSSNFDTSVHQINGAGITFNGDWDYITISGRTTSAGGGNGWWIDLRGRTQGAGIEFANGAGADFNTMEYMDLQGPGAITYTGDGRGIDATPFSSANGNIFSHMRIFDWESAIYHVGINGSTFEYLDVYDIMAANWSSYHPNGLYTSDSNNVIVRYSKFRKGPKGYGAGEGIFFEQGGGAANWQIYGNVFYDLNQSGWKAIQITSAVPGLKVFNNTFDNIIVPGIYVNGGSCGTGSESKNNLSYATSAPNACGATSNNLTISSSPMPFVNRAARDYRIVATTGNGYPRNAGTSIANLFTTDIAGVTFGVDGLWDVGAYEYESNVTTSSLSPPVGLTVR